MIDNFNLRLLEGGRTICRGEWTQEVSRRDHCFKIYLVVGGRGRLKMDEGDHTLGTGHFYFIDGHRLLHQSCARHMEVFWIHFLPESLLLTRVLRLLPEFHAWSSSRLAEFGRVFRGALQLFPTPVSSEAGIPVTESTCGLHACALGLVTLLLRDHRATPRDLSPPAIRRLASAVDFMEANYRTHPPLAEIARHAGLAPNYLHRLFKQTFGQTPHGFMRARCFDEARHLLLHTDLMIGEVARRSGFEDPLYFSRLFHRDFGATPREFRRRGGAP